MLRHPDATVIVALDGERVVGRLSLSRDPHPASHHVADLGLMVAESHRRRGIGKRLLEEAVTWARGVGIRKLELHVFPWNESALRLYESFGFDREGYRKRHYVRGDEFVDAVLMALEILGATRGINREDAPQQPVRQVAACPGVPHAEEEHEICEPHHHLFMTRFPGNYTSAPRKGTTSAPAGSGFSSTGSSRSASSCRATAPPATSSARAEEDGVATFERGALRLLESKLEGAKLESEAAIAGDRPVHRRKRRAGRARPLKRRERSSSSSVRAADVPRLRTGPRVMSVRCPGSRTRLRSASVAIALGSELLSDLDGQCSRLSRTFADRTRARRSALTAPAGSRAVRSIRPAHGLHPGRECRKLDQLTVASSSA